MLRERDLVVSPAEAMDALRAVVALPEVLERRESFEAALAGTLVKRAGDLPAFRELFAAYFCPVPEPEREHHHLHHDRAPEATLVGVDVVARPEAAVDAGAPRHAHGARIDLRRFFGEGAATPGHDHHAGDRLRLTWLGSDLVFDRAGGLPPAMARQDGVFGLRRVATAGRPGGLRPGGAIALPRDVVLRGVCDLWQAAGEDPDEELLDWIERAVGSGLRVAPEPRWVAGDAEPVLPDLGWDALMMNDLRRLERAVTRLGRRLGGAPGRRAGARSGWLDARATARRAAATAGVPFAPVYRGRRDDRPRLIVLCDVSLSVRGAARFLLQVSRAAQRQTGRVRSFVFVREVAEATRTLDDGDLEAAIATVFGRLLDTAEASDAGHALGAFLTRYGGVLSRRTTLLILGDGRNNGRDPRVDALAELRRRCRRVIWLTPEARGTWRLAGCDLARYAPWCDRVASVRTPADVEQLVARMAV